MPCSEVGLKAVDNADTRARLEGGHLVRPRAKLSSARSRVTSLLRGEDANSAA